MLSTRQERIKLHKVVLHPANNKLLNLLRLARPSQADMETVEIRNDIVAHSENCQDYRPTPIRLKASVPIEKNLVFGNQISVNLVFLN